MSKNTVFTPGLLSWLPVVMLLIAMTMMPSPTLGQPLRAEKTGLASKLSTSLIELNREYRDHLARPAGTRKTFFEPQNAALFADARYIVIDALPMTSSAALRDQLQGIGAVDAVSYGSIVSARVPLSAVEQLAALPELRIARPFMAVTGSGVITSQGDAGQRSDIARSTHGFDGAGVTVGVMSDSYDCPAALTTATQDVGSDDLPAGVNVLLDSCPGTDEGRAMMQIVHDVAPGASLAFRTGVTGTATFAFGIDVLVAIGADVIVDDIFFFSEPMFQDGVVAQSVDAAVANGVPYFSAAGNAADAGYESKFRNSGVPGPNLGTLHDFDPGPGTVTAQPFTIPVGASITLALQWNQPFFSVSGPPGATSDVEIYLMAADGTTSVAKSRSVNIGADAVEAFYFKNTGSLPQGVDTRFYLQIENFRGPDPDLVRYMYVADGAAVTVDQFQTYSGTSYGHAAAAGAMSVGAANYVETPAFGATLPVLEPFSSAGDVPIFFRTNGTPISPPELRLNPGIVAPDRVNTTFFGVDTDGDSFPNFGGTSAAAPHAAGAAALLLQFDNTLTPAEIYAALEDSTVDMGDAGYDFASGHGLLRTDAAVSVLVNAPPDLKPITGRFVVQNETINVPLSATDSGGGALVLSAPVLPAFCSFTDNLDGTGNIACSPTSSDIGRHAAVVAVHDGGTPPRSDSDGFYVVVTSSAVANHQSTAHDMNDDGVSDILWRNQSSGQNWLYLMNGATIQSSVGINTADTAWKTVGNGDFDNDGNNDILWRNQTTGQNWLYRMNGATIVSSVGVNTVPTDWQVVGNGDYNGDGASDILWRNAVTGQNWLYLMNGAAITSSLGVNTVSDLKWRVASSADFNGDGLSDILWRNADTGQNWLYLMHGATISSSVGVNTVGTEWQIVGDGDYDGDGQSDILWRNSVTGQNWLYLMNGASIVSSVGVNTVPTDWQVVGGGDYNGDLKADILWRNLSTGQNWMYLMDGATIVSSLGVNTVADPNWTIVDAR